MMRNGIWAVGGHPSYIEIRIMKTECPFELNKTVELNFILYSLWQFIL
jgi:hypothetical protein